jgi:glycerol kinase
VARPPVRETTALGAAYLAGLAVGLWKNIAEIGNRMPVERRFLPAMGRDRVERLTKGWKRALERSRNWAEA